MIDRRAFVGIAGGGLFAVPIAAHAQQAAKRPPTLGILAFAPGPPAGPAVLAGFYQGLQDLGWVEGRNLLVERRIAEASDERLVQAAAELVRLRVDVILAASGPASLNAAREATKTIPIVMVASSRDPVGTGLIQSYARPGGNITGLVTAPEELTGKQLEFLKAVVPHLARAGVLHNAAPLAPSDWIRLRPKRPGLSASRFFRSRFVGPRASTVPSRLQSGRGSAD
ncbi:MAG TPA: ABC transporter substrate-binding protein [Vicinamibacteria bacterium]